MKSFLFVICFLLMSCGHDTETIRTVETIVREVPAQQESPPPVVLPLVLELCINQFPNFDGVSDDERAGKIADCVLSSLEKDECSKEGDQDEQ
jgi:hypothetical protein